MKQTLKLTVALAVATALSGCATTSPLHSSNPDAKEARTATAKKTGVGAAIGCGLGAVAGALTGQDPKKGCVAGAVVGGAIGFAKAYREQLALARALEAEYGANVETAEVAPTGLQKEPTQRLKTLTVALPEDDAKAQELVAKVGALATNSATPVSVEIRGNATERAQVKQWLSQGGNPPAIVETDGPASLVVTVAEATA